MIDKAIKLLDKIEKDKWLHYAIALTATNILSSYLPWWQAGLIVLVLSVGKEVYDKVSKKGTASWYDLLADCCGIATGLI